MSTASRGATAPAPAVSVILPTYNRRRLLEDAIGSVVSQTFHDWELIVADDGSDDGTADYFETLGDPRIRPLLLAHGGSPARPRAAALGIARGHWVAFLDSDDLWLPEKLARQVQALTTSPSCRWSYTAYRLVDMNGDTMPFRPPTPLVSRSGWILEPLLMFEVSALLTTVLAERSLVSDVGGIDETIDLRDDYDLTVRLAAAAEVCAVRETLTLVREHAGRTTQARRRAALFRENERVFRKHAAATSSRTIRALCWRQCAEQLANMARALSQEGQHVAAGAAIARALRDDPLSPMVWRVAVGNLLRAVRLKH